MRFKLCEKLELEFAIKLWIERSNPKSESIAAVNRMYRGLVLNIYEKVEIREFIKWIESNEPEQSEVLADTFKYIIGYIHP
ncbi:hypothetical protein UGMREWDR_CDS0029 [Aeromonas phage GomatiRiver_11]|nr:hypothetical protein OBDJBBDK_00028 [Aeromonas phage AhFM11]WKW84196.1 hypothetical protein UGMREWDR_CDS0029 [Aeromonas phage GomatiRiver_11]